jgi:hypothetical protein
MKSFSFQHSSQLNPHYTFTNVGVGLLSVIKINFFNILSIGNLRPTLCANQQSMTYVQNTFMPTVVKRVGLKYIAHYFINIVKSRRKKRPTPTSINIEIGVLL